jgi:hypothetical protein
LPEGLKEIVAAGEALRLTDEIRAWHARVPFALHNHYGPTETHVVTAHPMPSLPEGAVPLGEPVAATEIRIVDNQGQLAPVGVYGEIVVGGPALAFGYWERPDLTASRFPETEDGRFYRTGDRGRYRNDGSLEYHGRFDDQVKLRGFRIELGEIDSLISEFPGVLQATTLLREDKPGDKQLVAYYSASIAIDEAALLDHLKSRLPEFMLPKLYAMPTLPLTPNGKVDRKALPAPETVVAGPVIEEPANELESALRAIWREVLGVAAIGLDQNFFDLGGHSLKLAQAHRLIGQRLQREVQLVQLFQHPTIRALAKQLATVEPVQEVKEEAQNIAEQRRAGRNARAQRRQRISEDSSEIGETL